MKAENGLGGIVKLAGKRRNPCMIRYTKGYIINGDIGNNVNYKFTNFVSPCLPVHKGFPLFCKKDQLY